MCELYLSYAIAITNATTLRVYNTIYVPEGATGTKVYHDFSP